MSRKLRNIWLAIGSIILLAVIIYFIFYYFGGESLFLKAQEEKEQGFIGYATLELNCKKLPLTQRSCCIESVYVMKQQDYTLANEDNKCPEEMISNTLKCPGSYIWCEPK